MNAVAVDMDLGEAVRLAPKAFWAIAGNWRRVMIPAALGMAIGLVLAPTIAAVIMMIVFFTIGPEAASSTPEYYEPFYVTIEIAGGLIGWKVGENRGVKRSYERFLDGLRQRGAPQSVPTRFSVLPSGLRATSKRGTIIAAWPSLLEILNTESHWLVQTDSLTMVIPKRAFQSPEMERAFVGELATHLSPDARQRSAAALKDWVEIPIE